MNDLQAPVTRVTLLEDRGFVARTARVELPAGLSRWRIPDVSPVLVDKTLMASVDGSTRVIHLRVERYKVLPPPPPPDEPAEEREQRALRRQRWDSDLRLLERELEGARKLQAQLLQEMALDVAWGKCDRETWERQLEELRTWKHSLLDSKLEVESQMEADTVAPPTYKAPPPSRLQADIVVQLEAPQAQAAELIIEYAVPGACWRPYHTAVLDSDGQLGFRSDGCVWQNTGEDWTNVELFFSTQRPSLGADPPPLPVDRLAARKKSQETVVQARDQEVNELALDASEAPARRQASVEVPGIDDGGESVNLRGLTPARVPSNGQPVRVEMFSFRAQTQVERVLMAEVCPEVLLKSTQKNQSDFPILAGPVDLIREAGLVGRSSTLYAAPGESFSLGWGPDPVLRAQRDSSKGQEDKDDLLGGWFRLEHKVTLRLSNLGQDSREVHITERVPVSEVKQVEIIANAKETSDGVTPDANGFVNWVVSLGPRGRKELKLVYAVRRRKEVVGL